MRGWLREASARGPSSSTAKVRFSGSLRFPAAFPPKRLNRRRPPTGCLSPSILPTVSSAITTALLRKFGIEPQRRSSGELELAARSWVRYLRQWRSELGRRDRWRDRLRAWPLGFTVSAYRLLELDRRDPSPYVPDFSLQFRSTRLNGFWNPIIGNKLVIAYIAHAVGVPTPMVLGCVVRGRPQSVDGSPLGSPSEVLARWIARAPRLVFRPHWSGAAEGVFFVDRPHGSWRVNDHAATDDELHRLIGSLDRYVVTAWVEQARYAQRIYPRTANTLRVLTLRDADGPFVAAAVHRFGSSASFPVDNFHAGRGGLVAAVDVATGALGTALAADASGRMQPHTHHPETGEPIAGVTIPHIREALDGMLRLCAALPEGHCVGWDTLMTDAGYCILEGNSPPGLHVWQVHQPLRAEPRAARFFADHGVGRRG